MTGIRRAGFTVIEAIIALAIFAVVAIAIFNTFVIGRRTWLIGTAQVTAQQAARNAINYMQRELAFSGPSHVTIALTNDSVTFNKPVSVDSSGDISWSNDITYSYDSTKKQIIRTLDGNDIVLAADVETLSFAQEGARGVRMALTTKRPTYIGSDIEYSVSYLLYLRND